MRRAADVQTRTSTKHSLEELEAEVRHFCYCLQGPIVIEGAPMERDDRPIQSAATRRGEELSKRQEIEDLYGGQRARRARENGTVLVALES